MADAARAAERWPEHLRARASPPGKRPASHERPVPSGGWSSSSAEPLASLSDGSVQRSTAGCRAAACGALTLCVLLLTTSSLFSSGSSGDGFVSVNGTRLEVNCRPFLIAGASVENLALAPLARQGRRLQPGELSGRQKVRQLFQRAAATGLNVIRLWAHTSDAHGEWALQRSPGVYDEDAFAALDFVVAEAGRAGLRLVLSLVDNWSYHGGVDEFVDWSGSAPPRDARYPCIARAGDASPDAFHSAEHQAYEATRHALFFSDPGCRAMYAAHMRAILLRRNSVTRQLYRDDPAIMGYDLINEPRCSSVETPACPQLLTAWLREMSAAAAALAPRQLVTIGSEGFWAAAAAEQQQQQQQGSGAGARASPGAWAAQQGQDFVAQASLPNISYAAIHLWPQQWRVDPGDRGFAARWLREHAAAAAALGKPLLLEEVGAPLEGGGDPPEAAIAALRDPAFREVYGLAEAAYAAAEEQQQRRQAPAGSGSGGGALESALAGTLFWRWAFAVFPSDVPGRHGVAPHHSTMGIVYRHARHVAALNAALPSRAECLLPCWVPRPALAGLLRRCVRDDAACQRQLRRRLPAAAAVAAGRLPTYASRAECCRAGLGAYANGCTIPW